jgi:hypothetical protein
METLKTAELSALQAKEDEEEEDDRDSVEDLNADESYFVRDDARTEVSDLSGDVWPVGSIEAEHAERERILSFKNNGDVPDETFYDIPLPLSHEFYESENGDEDDDLVNEDLKIEDDPDEFDKSDATEDELAMLWSEIISYNNIVAPDFQKKIEDDEKSNSQYSESINSSSTNGFVNQTWFRLLPAPKRFPKPKIGSKHWLPQLRSSIYPKTIGMPSQQIGVMPPIISSKAATKINVVKPANQFNQSSDQLLTAIESLKQSSSRGTVPLPSSKRQSTASTPIFSNASSPGSIRRQSVSYIQASDPTQISSLTLSSAQNPSVASVDISLFHKDAIKDAAMKIDPLAPKRPSLRRGQSYIEKLTPLTLSSTTQRKKSTASSTVTPYLSRADSKLTTSRSYASSNMDSFDM